MIRINLLPYQERKGTGRSFTFDKTRIVPLAVLGVVLAACLTTLMVQGARLTSLEQEVATAQAESEKYKKTIDLINEMVSKENELNRRLQLVSTLDENRFKTVRVLDEFARRVPRYMWLTSVKEVSPDRMAIDGVAFSNLVVSDLMSSLESSEVFGQVELSVAKRKEVEGQNVVSFTVTTSVNPNAGNES
jgi:Tfp pilus assembly protein PilN